MLNNFNKNTIFSFLESHVITYPTPLNLNYFWSFGSLAGITLVIQIITGCLLVMYYTPEVNFAFDSVEYIMRNVPNGWLIRYSHANGASMFFIVIYCHIFRGLYYGSYMYPRDFLWISGVIIFLLTMATAFIGYVLPWGQMSLWGATVITNLFSAIPFIGTHIVEWIWGAFTVSNPTLHRFLSLHFLFPFLIVGATIIHLSLLHQVGSSNSLGIDDEVDTVSFYPYYYAKDLFAFYIYSFIFGCFVYFYPNILGHPDNYIPANPMMTPAHIVPEWYFLPFYAILRSIPDKLGGVLMMAGAIVILIFLPFINTSKIQGPKFRPIYTRFFFWCFLFNFILLGWVGQKPVEEPYVSIGLICTIYYFFNLLVVLPFAGFIENKLLKNL